MLYIRPLSHSSLTIILTPHKHFDMTNVSEKALIREMDASELIEYLNKRIASKSDFWGWWLSDDTCLYIDRLYSQLTGHPLF